MSLTIECVCFCVCDWLWVCDCDYLRLWLGLSVCLWIMWLSVHVFYCRCVNLCMYLCLYMCIFVFTYVCGWVFAYVSLYKLLCEWLWESERMRLSLWLPVRVPECVNVSVNDWIWQIVILSVCEFVFVCFYVTECERVCKWVWVWVLVLLWRLV